MSRLSPSWGASPAGPLEGLVHGEASKAQNRSGTCLSLIAPGVDKADCKDARKGSVR